MVRVKQFCQENKIFIYEICSLENVSIANDMDNFLNKLRNGLQQKYLELLHKFEECFPKIITPIHFLYWSFIRIKIATTFLDLGDTLKANEILSPCIDINTTHKTIDHIIRKLTTKDLSETKLSANGMFVFSIVAGVLLTLFNVMATTHLESMKNKQLTSTPGDPLHWLCCAQRVYRLYTQQNPPYTGPELWDKLLYSGLKQKDGFVDFEGLNKQNISLRRLVFEYEYTKTIFLTAQVHQLNGNQALSADHCHLTLLRLLTFGKYTKTIINSAFCLQNNKIRFKSSYSLQHLEEEKFFEQNLERVSTYYFSEVFNPTEWATNAITLSDYFSSIEKNKNCYYKTFECLLSAINVVNEATGEGKILPGQMSLDLLEKGAKLRDYVTEDRITTDEVKLRKLDEFKDANKFGSMFNLELQPILAELLDYKVDAKNPNLNTISQISDLVYDLVIPPRNAETASRIFRMILHCIVKSEQFYVLQDHCTDAVGLIQDRSKAYRLMAVFESSINRQCCMHKRRIDMLNDVLKQLNPNYYLHICRQLTFELAEALSTLRDLKKKLFDEVSVKGSQNSVHYAHKSNNLTKRAISVYQDFLKLYGVQSAKTALDFTDDDIKPLITTYLYTARLYSQFISTDNIEKIRNLSKALDFYEQLVTLADHHIQRNPTTPIKDCDELRIAKEMVVLLPVKLSRLSRGEVLTD
ncbi:KIF1-binding protein isoform 1 [Schistosoma japonicum]|uniref:KIF-binding protein n=1 Tax=Schistosoma japonicum TaxID=6182 RepID=A0A4Z2CSL1_SCHJA|nr:KIF1-binding protein isoform 1 [Schistosoma japonicum]